MTEFLYPNARLLVFARAPVQGRVKTRLHPALGAEAATQLYKQLLHHIVSGLQAARLAPLQLWADNNPDHEAFVSICNKKEIHLQKGSDLGAKMAHASARALAEPGVEHILLLGTDCPALSPDYLERALVSLGSEHDAVIGPAEDGGYVMLGLKAPRPELFTAIDWGTERVLEQTLAQGRQLGLKMHCLEALWDVDRPADLQRLRQSDRKWAIQLDALVQGQR